MRKLKFAVKVLTILVLSLVIIVGLSIPIAIVTEGKVNNPGTPLGKVVFRNANIIPMDSNYVLSNHALFVENNIIVKMCPDSLASVEDFVEVDAKGQYILPGLIDMHAHIFDRSDLTNYLAYGVTRVRNMMGFPMHLRWKEQWSAGDFPGCEMVTASPTLNFGEGTDPFHKTLGKDEDAAAVVQQYYDDGYDFIKIYDGLTREQFVDIMKKSSELGLKVGGHPPVSVPREELLNSRLTSFEHIEEIYNTYMDRAKNDSLALVLAHEFVKAKIPVCVTLSAYHNIYEASNSKELFLHEVPYEEINPLLIFIGNRLLADYLNPTDKLKDAITSKRVYLTKLTKLFYDEGVPLIFGTDTGPNLTVPGLTVHHELLLLKEAGISPYNILRSATVDAMSVYDSKINHNGIVVGGDANFLIVSDNPLRDLAELKRPASIVTQGILYDSAAIQKLKALGKDKSSTYVSMGNLLQQFFNK